MKIRYILVCLLCLALLVTGCSKGGDERGEGMTEHSHTTASSTKNSSSTTAKTTAATTAAPKPVVLPKSNNLQFDASREGTYNYCPAAMKLSDGTMYIYYCTNTESYEVVDYIGCRKGARKSDGTIEWGEEKIVLSPGGAGAWDAHHVCDPSVIAGSFAYGGETYGYLMAYLGCTSYDNQENKIGLAVAKSPEGPFVKVGDEPFIDFTVNSNVQVFQWGVGQPSLVSQDKQGKVWLFYTKGDVDGTRLMVDVWNLSDLDSPVGVTRQKLSENGLKNLDGGNDFMNNADLIYDAANNRFYASSDCHPNPTDTPNYISAHFRVNYFTPANSTSFGSFTWSTLKQVGPVITEFVRNHNTGVLRDAYGHMTDDGYLTVFYTVSNTGNSSLWTYRIYDYYMELPK